LFLSKAERDYLLDIDQASHDYVCVKSRLNRKLKVFVDPELPLLLEKGYLSDIAEFRNIADFRNAPNGLVAQLAERSFVTGINDNNNDNNESKSPRWDLNPRVLSNAMMLDETFLLSRLKGKENRASKL
jgi:hypothetical protein